MMAQPMKTLDLHYPMIQFLIIHHIFLYSGYQSHVHSNDFCLFQKLRFGGRQSNVSMEITASRVTETTISIVNSQRIRVALSSLLEWMNYKNLTANLLGLSWPFYYWQSHLPHGSADSSLCIQFASTLETRQDRSLDYVLARRMTRISATKIICIHNKLIKSQSSHKATHFRSQLFQLPDIFRFFDFLFGGSLTPLVSFSFNRNAAFFTNVSPAKSVSAIWLKDRPRFRHIITFHLSEIVNYFVIMIERLYLTQRRSNMAVKLTRNEHDCCHGNIWLTSTKT